MAGKEKRSRRWRAILAVGMMIGLSACGGGETESKQAAPPAGKTEPPKAMAPRSPKPALARVTAATRKTYQWYCAQCHGVQGHGDGINAKSLTVPPRNHTKAAYLETRTDQQLFDAIKRGGLAVGRAPCMPAWGHTLDDNTIHSLVRHIRELCNCEAL